MRRVWRWSKRLLLLLVVIALVTIAFLAWLLGTESGARFAFAQVDDVLQTENLQGSILGGLDVTKVTLPANTGATYLRGVSYRLDWQALFSRTVHLQSLTVERVELPAVSESSAESSAQSSSDSPPLALTFSTALPVAIHIDAMAIGQVQQGGETLAGDLAGDLHLPRSGDLSLQLKGQALANQFTLAADQLNLTLRDNNVVNAAGGLSLTNQQAFGKTTATVELQHGANQQARQQTGSQARQLQMTITAQHQLTKKHISKEVGESISPLLLGAYHYDGKAFLDLQAEELTLQVQKLTSPIVDASGKVTLTQLLQTPHISTRIQLTQSNLTTLVPDLAGFLNATITATARMGEANHADVKVDSLKGQVQGKPVQGNAVVQLRGDQLQVEALNLRSGESSITSTASLDLTDQGAIAAQLDAAIADLGDFLPKAKGKLQISASIGGSQTRPDIDLIASGSTLSFGNDSNSSDNNNDDISIAALEAKIEAQWSEQAPLTLALKASNLRQGDLHITQAAVVGSGTVGQHSLEASATLEEGEFSTQLAGGFTALDTAPKWQGQWQALAAKTKDYGHWSMAAPSKLSVSAEAQLVENLCILGEWLETQQRACVAINASSSATDVDIVVERLQASVMKAFAPTAPELDGLFAGDVTVRQRVDANGVSSRKVAWQLRSDKGKIKNADLSTTYSSFALQGGIENDRLTVDFGVQVDGNPLTANVAVEPLKEENPSLSGTVKGKLPSLKFLSVFLPEVQQLDGKADLELTLSGRIQQPKIAIAADANVRQMTLASLGIQPRNTRIEINSINADRVRIQGRTYIDKKRLNIDGSLAPFADDINANIKITGKTLPLVQTPDLTMWLSPSLRIKMNGPALAVSGSVDVERGKLLLKDQASVVTVSDDVVLIDKAKGRAEADEVAAQAMGLSAAVQLRFVEPLLLEGQGLDAELTGTLKVIAKPGKPPVGDGELQVTGTYAGYGQDLIIRGGRVTFSNTPLDNPGLNILAVREVDAAGVSEVGVRIRGSANQPKISLYSDKAIDQGEVLALLLLGRPLNELSQEEGGGLADVALQLGLAGGDEVSRWLGNRFGIDRVYIKGSKQGARVVVAKRISKRLSINFQQAIFAPINEVQVRYKLSKSCSIAADSGADQGIDLQCKIEAGR